MRDVIAIGKQRNGQLVWLEKGKSSAGFIHIMEQHKDNFEKKGIYQSEIPYYLMAAVTNGEIIGYQSTDKSRPIYEFYYNGQIHKVAITVGSNGFIVGANPVSSN